MTKKTIRQSLYCLLMIGYTSVAMTMQGFAAPNPMAINIDLKKDVMLSAIIEPQPQSAYWILVDSHSHAMISGAHIADRIEPASMTKVMTAYMTFEALKNKTITLEQIVEGIKVTEGSRMFLEDKKPVDIASLIQGLIVQSGNDAAVTLAQTIAGSEAKFAGLMNQTAKKLGLHNSSFTNASGLPDPNHYSTVEDMAIVALALIRDFPEYYHYYSQKEYTYNKITQPNRNELLWQNDGVDGLKTGHTEQAGYCLISSAKRGERRLLAVVAKSPNNKTRFIDSRAILNYGFENTETVQLYKVNQPIDSVEVKKGLEKKLSVGLKAPLYITIPSGQQDQIKATLVFASSLSAPIVQGQEVGSLVVTVAKKAYGCYPLVALQNIQKSSWLAGLWEDMTDFVYGLWTKLWTR